MVREKCSFATFGTFSLRFQPTGNLAAVLVVKDPQSLFDLLIMIFSSRSASSSSYFFLVTFSSLEEVTRLIKVGKKNG